MIRASAMTGRGGPSAKADWWKVSPEHSTGRVLWAVPDAGAGNHDGLGGLRRPRRVTHHVIAAPALLSAPAPRSPLVGLTLVLSRSPQASEESLLPLVTGGVFTISLSTTPTTADLNRVVARADDNNDASVDANAAAPIFVRRAKWTLICATGAPFAQSVVEGNGAVALSQTVTRALTLSLLSALRGENTDLLARCEVAFRAADRDVNQRTRRRAGDADLTNAAQTTVVVTTHASPVERTLALERPLSHLIREAIGSWPLEAIVRAVSPGEDGILRAIGGRSAAPRDHAPITQRVGFAVVGDTVAALPAVLKTSVATRIQAHALAASDLAIRPGVLANRWQIHDLVLQPPAAGLQSLPVIEGDDPLWPDRIDSARFWYAPEFAIVEPLATSSPLDSPFLFSFAVVGHDQQGRPGLEATIRLTLRMGMSTAARAAWQARNSPRCDPVTTGGLSVALEIPYRDQMGATVAQTVNAAEIRVSGDTVVATFALTDQWARLAYGALGTQGFQNRPAKLNVSYVFSAYVPMRERETRLTWGGKVAAVNAERLRAPAATRGAPSSMRRPQFLMASAVHAQTPLIFAHHAVLAQPAIMAPPKTYGIRTQGRSAQIDVLMPCGERGAFYVQTADPQTGDSDVAIGCRDAWTLGQIRLILYEPVEVYAGASGPGYSVFRSVQVPGRFLVVPKAYTLSRFEPTDARAYKPAAYLFSNVDANHPERTTCILMAALRPAITPADRRALIDALRTAAHPNPTLEWPTELALEPRYVWALPSAAQIAPAVAKTPEGFQVSFAAGVDQVLQLKAIVEMSGVTASVVFPLADGTSLQSTLDVTLRRIDGPWEAGAIDVAITGGRAVLSNRVERAVDVDDLLTYAAGTRTGAVTIERRIETGASLEIALPTGTDAALPRYALADSGGSLEEIRIFIEDIYTNVVFVCLFDLAVEQIRRLSLDGRIVGVAQTASATLEGNVASAELSFVLPLTVYLAQPTLQYRLTIVAADGSTRGGPWRDWRLDVRGNVVELNKNELQET